MREILTIVACVLAVLLTAALIGPYFVDWSAQRLLIEHRLSEATGAKVTIAGAIDLRLLPTPSLRAEDLSASSRTPGGPSLTVRRASFELAVAPLIRGEIQFLRADLDRPKLRLTLDPDGAVSLPSRPIDLPGKLEFAQLRLRDASLVLARGAQRPPWRLDHIDLQAHATSLQGPSEGSGRIERASGDVLFRFSTGALQNARLRIEASVRTLADSSSARARGALTFANEGAATKVAYAGSASVNGLASIKGVPGLPWRIAGRVQANSDGVTLKKGEFRVVQAKTTLAGEALGAIRFGADPRANLTLNAQQLDIDRFLAAEGKGAAKAWVRRVAVTLSRSSPLGDLPWPLDLSVHAQTVTLGARTIAGAQARVRFQADAPLSLAIAASGPDDSHLSLDGALQTGPAAVLRGRVNMAAPQARRFAKWIAPEFPNVAARLASLPFGSIAVAGALDLSAASFALNHLVLGADRTNLRGSIVYTRAIGGRRARLFADLRSHALDLDALPDLSGLARSATDTDLALTLDARAVRLARFGHGMVDAGRIDVDLTRRGSDLQLRRLSLSNIGGADFSAHGSANDASARLKASLHATRLADLAGLIGRIAPGALADALAKRAVALSPASLALDFKAARGEDATWRPISLALNGTARGVTLAGEVKPLASDPKKIDARLDMQGRDSSILLRQIGVATLPIADTGQGQVHASMNGPIAGPFAAHVSASLAGSHIDFTGRFADGQDGLSASGDVQVASPDAAPLLRLSTLAVPDLSLALPATFAAKLTADPSDVSLTSISGAVAGVRVAGNLTAKPGREAPRLSGTLSMDRLSLGSIAALAFGPEQRLAAGALWSSEKLAPGLADPPSTNLTLSVARFVFAPGLPKGKATFGLKVESGLAAVDHLSMTLGRGTLAGSLTFRRDGPSAALAGSLQARRIAFDRPWLSGSFSGDVRFTATGENAAALAGGLAGDGLVKANRLRIARDDPNALARVIAMSDQKGFSIDQTRIETALASELDKGPLLLPRASFDVSAAGGRIRLTSRKDAASGGSPSPDIVLGVNARTLRVRERVRLSESRAPKQWPTRRPPHMNVVWSSALPVAAASRSIEAAGAVADLSARAIARQSARIDALKADIRERAFFDRRLKGLRFLHKRERQEAKFEARRAQEARRQAQREAAEQAKGAQAPLQPTPPTPGEILRGTPARGRRPTDLRTGPTRYAPAPAPPPALSGFAPDPLSSGPY